MRHEFDLPDAIFRALEARAASEGVRVEDLLARYVIRELCRPSREALRGATSDEVPFVSAYDLMKDACGIFRSEVPDLATSPKHMEGFGRD